MIMFETDRTARALLASKANGAKGSVFALTENNFALLKSILSGHGTVEHVLFAGGSPCQGFSRASSNPRGVGDDRSALIWVFHALPKAATDHLGGNWQRSRRSSRTS